MKKIPVLLLFAVAAAVLAAAESTEKNPYMEVELSAIKAMPEDFKNKNICITTDYIRYLTTFPEYIEKSGFKPGSYFLLEVVPLSFPLMLKKSDAVNEMVSKLPQNKSIKIKAYGRVEKFRIEPARNMLPRYYLDVDKIEDAGPNLKKAAGTDDGEEEGGVQDGERKRKWQKNKKGPGNPRNED